MPRLPQRLSTRTTTPVTRGYAVGFLVVQDEEIVNAYTFTGSDPHVLASMAAGRLVRSGIDADGQAGDALCNVMTHALSRIDLDDPDLPDLPDISFHPTSFHISEPEDESVPQVSVSVRAGHNSWTGRRPAVEVVAAQTETAGPYKTGQPVDVVDEYGDEYVARVLAPTPGRGRFLAFSERRDLLIDCVAPPEFSRIPSRRLVHRGGRNGRKFFAHFVAPPSLEANLHHITAA